MDTFKKNIEDIKIKIHMEDENCKNASNKVIILEEDKLNHEKTMHLKIEEVEN